MYRREMKELKENEELIKENRELKAEMYRTNEKVEVMDREKKRNNVAFQR
jgi:predicted nuclease with TOPRIM domain